ncbi:MAG: 2-polyprenyl-3-methyl-6-methoxy-1,4-benzoquinone monooxygenase [Gammaproteobacteria bacterium]|nr:2-polyprenyl-3-methyl-6-methoxy-1,4-benzoquinone monooxygenase [Gammaproteobacteria bacterium]
MTRNYSPADRLLMGLSRLLAPAADAVPPRPNPAARIGDKPLDESARRHAAGLMRVNHAGEIAAQALYQGQALTARNSKLREHLLHAAAEEKDHLRWCEERLAELGEGPSRLGPLWYAGSFAIGAAAGLAGDRWSLGFVAETEKQVGAHLEGHLGKLPEQDRKSRAIVKAMRDDEARHGQEATARGGRALPRPIQEGMRRVARVMTRSAYRF